MSNAEIPDGTPQHAECGTFMQEKTLSTHRTYWKCSRCDLITDNLDKVNFINTE